jgi:hypothetical protein
MSVRRLLFALVCLLWAGLVLGVGFAEAMKFRAPTLTRLIAFDVGRTVFAASQQLQLLPLGLALACAASSRVSRATWGFLTAAVLALLVQTVWLFPILDARAETFLHGGVPVGPSPHAAYGSLEVLKLVALVVAAVLALRGRPEAAAT